METPPITWEPSGAETLVVTTAVHGCPPDRLFDYWTIPALLCQWWPKEAEVDPRVGGAYLLAWPQMDWRLRGTYTVFERGRSLAFTWKWDHDPEDATPKLVTVAFTPLATATDGEALGATQGTALALTHGLYLATPDEQELRIEHHLAGWRHFLPALQRAASNQVE